jgi:hypothetical protein
VTDAIPVFRIRTPEYGWRPLKVTSVTASELATYVVEKDKPLVTLVK